MRNPVVICECGHHRDQHGPPGDYSRPPLSSARCIEPGCICGRFHPRKIKAVTRDPTVELVLITLGFNEACPC